MRRKNAPTTVNRRTFAKLTAAGIGTASLTSTGVGAQSENEFVGVAYDPVTLEVLGDASGVVNRSDRVLSGRLMVLNETIPFNDLPAFSKVAAGRSDDLVKFRYEKTVPDLGYINVRSYSGGGITGVVSTLGGRRVAYSLVDASKGSAIDVENTIEDVK